MLSVCFVHIGSDLHALWRAFCAQAKVVPTQGSFRVDAVSGGLSGSRAAREGESVEEFRIYICGQACHHFPAFGCL